MNSTSRRGAVQVTNWKRAVELSFAQGAPLWAVLEASSNVYALPAKPPASLRLLPMQKGSNNNHPKAIFTFGCFSYNGLWGVHKDIQRAEELIKKAARAGDEMAVWWTGNWLLEGKDGTINPDYDGAKAWFDKCSTTNARAQFQLGRIYQQGLGSTRVDVAKAMECFRASAEELFPPGIQRFATALHEAGRRNEALLWFIKGGSHELHLQPHRSNIAFCQYHAALGSLHLKSSFPRALFWAKRAKRNGHDEATALCDQLQVLISKNCGNCKKPYPTVRCSGCKSVSYCDSKCQKAGWTKHKSDCRTLPTISTAREIYFDLMCSFCTKADPQMVCGRCKSAYYCDNQQFQESHWAVHKNECREMSRKASP
jgi:TPR repeat protein